MHKTHRHKSSGFTLIELSIVLVIIGLIVGGVLVGRDLIAAAAIRAQISQIEKLNTAVNTFRGKYNCLPGDCLNASNFGMLPRTGGIGDGDGDWKIATCGVAPDQQVIMRFLGCENALFWSDLYTAGLIGGSMTGESNVTAGSLVQNIDLNHIAYYIPSAKIGNNNYLMVSSFCQNFNSGTVYMPGSICYELAVSQGTNGSGAYEGVNGAIDTVSPGLTPVQAYAIDVKMDDGLPISGQVQLGLYVDNLFYAVNRFCAATDAANNVIYNTNNSNNISPDKVACALGFSAQ